MPETPPGLCAACDHARVIRGARSHFWLCALSAVDSRFPRYPRLPVRECAGYQRGRPQEERPD